MYLLSVDHRDLHVLTHSFPTRRSSDLTPLNAILGTAELLCDTTLEGGQRRSLDTIVQSGDHLLGIVNDILDFSKIEAGMLVLDEQVLDLRRSVDEAVALIAQRAADKGLDLRIEFSATMPTRSEEHTSELQSLMRISYAVFC